MIVSFDDPVSRGGRLFPPWWARRDL